MNQNDMDRYFWRRGHPWSGDYRRLTKGTAGPKLSNWAILIVIASSALTAITLLLLR
jgi:hypothetical protein